MENKEGSTSKQKNSKNQNLRNYLNKNNLFYFILNLRNS